MLALAKHMLAAKGMGAEGKLGGVSLGERIISVLLSLLRSAIIVHGIIAVLY